MRSTRTMATITGESLTIGNLRVAVGPVRTPRCTTSTSLRTGGSTSEMGTTSSTMANTRFTCLAMTGTWSKPRPWVSRSGTNTVFALHRSCRPGLPHHSQRILPPMLVSARMQGTGLSSQMAKESAAVGQDEDPGKNAERDSSDSPASAICE